MCKLSIIVPIYNVEKYLEKCINSILNQSFKDFELILVDDGSPDNCGNMCNNYSKLDARIQVVHKENGGLSSARNAGLEIAKGKYVAFVDSDDWINQTMFEKLYISAEKNNVDIAQCKFIRVFNENFESNYNETNNKKNITILNNIEALNNLYNEKYIETVVTWNKIYKRSLFNDISFPQGKIHEDEFTTHKLLYKANKIVLIDEELYYYRQTPNSIMNSEFSIKRLDRLEAMSERMEFFKQIRNKELYEKTLRKYEDILKKYYYICESSLLKTNVLKKIKNMYKIVFNKYIFSNEIKIKEKIMSTIFFMSPRVYKNIQTLRGKKIY